MKMVDTVRQVLEKKGSQVWAIHPDATIYQALELMAENNVGALLAMEKDALAGIFSERDYARRVVLKGKSSRGTTVREIMVKEVITVGPDHLVQNCMRAMIENRIRHLPVVEGGQVIGLVSIGDLVNWVISAQKETISHLEGYITGRYPG